MIRRPRSSPLFPYTTLSRSEGIGVNGLPVGARLALGDVVIELTKPAGPCSRMDEIRTGLRAQLEGCRGTLAKVVVPGTVDRKSTRLNSSHDQISYAVFCLHK